MNHRKAYMYIDFQQNRVDRSIKTAHTIIFAKQLSYINLQLEIRILKITPLDMYYPKTNIQADFEINRPVRYRNTTKRNY